MNWKELLAIATIVLTMIGTTVMLSNNYERQVDRLIMAQQSIIEAEVDIIKTELAQIKQQVSNHLPTEIRENRALIIDHIAEHQR